MNLLRWLLRRHGLPRLSSRLDIIGRLQIHVLRAPRPGALWAPSPRAGLPLIDQALAAGFRVEDVLRRRNTFVNNGRDLLRNFLANDAGLAGIQRYAVGTGTTAAARTQTQLVTEVFRAAQTNTIKDAQKLTVQLWLSTSQANGNTLAEGGPFGNGATDTANSGTCIARAAHTGVVKDATKGLIYSHDLLLG